MTKMFALAAVAAMTLTSASAMAEVQPMVSMALTYGGDTLASVVYTDGSGYDIKAGSLFQFSGGIEISPEESPVSYQLSLGYHFDRVNASNGTIKFTRMPLEGLALYAVNENWRFGGGLRKALSPKYSEAIDGYSSGSTNLTSALGIVLQGEYLPSPKYSVFVRYVSEKFKLSYYDYYYGPLTVTYKGNHLGLGASLRF